MARSGRAVAIVIGLLMAGCATAPPAGQQEARLAVFYPPLPNPPRIQYLASFSSPKDLQPKKSASRFADFVVGKTPEDDTVIKKPYGAALFDGKLYVVDTRGPGYAIFDLQKQSFKFVTGTGPGKMRKPINLTVDQDGTKYVTDTSKDQILAFDRHDQFIRAYGKNEQFKPGDVEVVGERLYVSDLKHHNVQVLDKQSGKLLFAFGDDGTLGWPTNMTVAPDGYLYVADAGRSFIQQFTLDGTTGRQFGALGTRLGQFARPRGVALDRQGRLYVVDAAFENIQIFNPDGRLLLFFGEPGNAPENLNLPAAVVIDYDAVPFFQTYADPNFELEYVIIVVNQFGRSKVSVFGFGQFKGMDYSAHAQPATTSP